MKQSQLFTKTRNENPSGEESVNAKLLIRGGFIYKEVAGAYVFLPLGMRVLEKINNIIHEEMQKAGGQLLHMTSLQDPDIWKATDRWNDETVDVWFKSQLHVGGEAGFGFTHEEPLTRLMKNHIDSYRDLPVYAYQIQTKFRNETRAKSGIMRGREFLMKDLYSFSRDQEEHDIFYEKMKHVYHYTFERLGIGDKTYLTFASGGSFAQFSHEFQTECVAGEDIVYVDREKEIAVNEEVYTDEVLAELGLEKDRLEKIMTAEVGNIFTLGTKFSESLNLFYTNEKGDNKPVVMGSYGIGPSRVMGVITELFHDKDGIIWPEEVAPFQVHLLVLGKDESVLAQAEAVYLQLLERDVEVLFDDRPGVAPGEKFADADLIGIPYRVVISERSLDKGGAEVKRRNSDDAEIVSLDDLFDRFH